MAAVAIGVAAGCSSAFFLWTLEAVTAFREGHSWMLFLLPVGGFAVGALYHRSGRSVEAGNNLILEEFHDPRAVIPIRMASLVLVGTWITHLFGGSAGREGTAVQMAASMADQLSSVKRWVRVDRRVLLMSGLAGGFGSVFGVPFAGMIFGIEVLAIGHLELGGLLPCAIASIIAHVTALAFGIHHTTFVPPSVPVIGLTTIAGTLLAGVMFGLAARTFVLLTERIKSTSERFIPARSWRAAMGGALLALVYAVQPATTRFAGLGIPWIQRALTESVPTWDWAGKTLLTALTLGTGFRGGEVTPLLFVGATLGNAMSEWLPIGLPCLSALGFVAVFGGAANTPLTCVIMAMEIFGPRIGFFAAIACFTSYVVSSHRGIYHAQRVRRAKPRFRRWRRPRT